MVWGHVLSASPIRLILLLVLSAGLVQVFMATRLLQSVCGNKAIKVCSWEQGENIAFMGTRLERYCLNGTKART